MKMSHVHCRVSDLQGAAHWFKFRDRIWPLKLLHLDFEPVVRPPIECTAFIVQVDCFRMGRFARNLL